jgi:hypothetical protein
MLTKNCMVCYESTSVLSCCCLVSIMKTFPSVVHIFQHQLGFTLVLHKKMCILLAFPSYHAICATSTGNAYYLLRYSEAIHVECYKNLNNYSFYSLK